MKQFIKNFNNFVKKILFKVQNKTNNNFIKNFNNFLKRTIFKDQNKTNNNFIKNFNNYVEKTIFKVQNKKNNNFKISNLNKISNFNKYLITFISLLFFFLFYLSIPGLYDKAWLQDNIEKQLLKEFRINFSTSSDISYRILPAPHFLVKDSKIFKEQGDKTTSFVDIKNLEVFVKHNNFFDKKKMIIKNIKINNANFSLLRNDFKLLNDTNKNNFSNKKIEINKSNIFFKDNSEEIIAIIKISKAFLFFDDENLLNLFNLKGNIFNIPFVFDHKREFNSSKNSTINIIAETLKLSISDTYESEQNNIYNRENIISFLSSSIKTGYKIEDDIVIFNSQNSKIKNSIINYNGKISINPFDLNLNIISDNYEIFKTLNLNSLLMDLIKSKLLFNENININTSITASSNKKKEFFQNAKINFNIVNGKINLNKTKLINKKIGLLELNNSNLSFQNDELILNTNIMINLNNVGKLYSLLQTNKKSRKEIKNIFINLDYNFLTNNIEFNNVKIDNKKVSDELFRAILNFSDNKLNTYNKSRRLLNQIFDIYEG
tara:strand:+ start:86 stop:1726 length:1641 start_codon:yes stop_codon:yes gene_type:complete